MAGVQQGVRQEDGVVTRSQEAARLRDLLIERCPQHAVEIFGVVVDLITATLRESHEATLKAVDGVRK